jgi:hypothetical protein
MMMVSGNYNFPSNGYYNPPKPRVTTQNYQEAVKYGDDAKYGGNGDGQLDLAESNSIKKVFDYAADYYKNMYQQSGDTKYMAWSNHYSNSLTATENMNQNMSIFQFAFGDSDIAGRITDKDITTLAGKDGNADEISLTDLAKPQFPNFQEGSLTTTNYENTVNYGDDKRYGGDGDGTVNATELTNVKKTFDYAADYYKNQASLATSKADKEKFMAWSNYYGNDAKAAENMMNNMSAFQDNNFAYAAVMKRHGEPPDFNATLKSIKELAGKDGNTETISLRDLAKKEFRNFVENDPPIELGEPKGGPHRPMYNQPPQYGGGQYGQYPPMYNQPPQYGGGQYGQYPPMYNQPPQYGGGQYGQYPPMYNQPPQYGGGQYGQYPPMYNQPPYDMNAPFPSIQGLPMQQPNGAGMFGFGTLRPVQPPAATQRANDVSSILAQQKEATIKTALQGVQSNLDAVGRSREQLANTLKAMIDNQLDRSPESPSTQALAARTEAIKKLDDALAAQQQGLLSKKSFYESGQAAQYTTQELQSIMKVENTLGSMQSLTVDLDPQSETAKELQRRMDALEKMHDRLIKRQPAEEPLTPKTATQILIDNFGAFESLLDTDKNRQDGVASFDKLVAYNTPNNTLQPYNPQQPWSRNASPEVKRAVQYFIDNRATTFDVMEGLNDNGKKDGIFSIDELRKFLAQQG